MAIALTQKDDTVVLTLEEMIRLLDSKPELVKTQAIRKRRRLNAPSSTGSLPNVQH